MQPLGIRHQNGCSFMGGGPGSGIHRSDDGGDSHWRKSNSDGLCPHHNMGKIGLQFLHNNQMLFMLQ